MKSRLWVPDEYQKKQQDQHIIDFIEYLYNTNDKFKSQADRIHENRMLALPCCFQCKTVAFNYYVSNI